MDLKLKLKELYNDKAESLYQDILDLIKKEKVDKKSKWLTEKDVMLITYGDSVIDDNNKPLKVLKTFLNNNLKGYINNVHLLPMFPFTSDDGFSVVDYLKINPDLGNWDDIISLSKNYDLMYDAVMNHISKESKWFKGFLKGDKKYEDFFIECDPKLDYSMVTRPRALPLYYKYDSFEGPKYIWATFSEDQVDLNYKNPKVLLEMLKVLITYAKNGARFIRLDAIGFLWKELGTTSIHLKETHDLIKIMRYVIDETYPGTILISETNVPHLENISYFGENDDEASLVYQFPLPPLTFFSFLTGDATKLTNWAKSLKETKLHPKNTYFNFLSSHDGIGMRPTEGILTDDERELMVQQVLKSGGAINYKNNPDGTKSPYELNATFFDAITYGEEKTNIIKKFIASQAIMMFLKGMPAIYIHSLLGTRNDIKGMKESGINRRINRKKLHIDNINYFLNDKYSEESQVFNEYKKLIQLKISDKSFSPDASEEILSLDKRVFSLIRSHQENDYKALVLINVSKENVILNNLNLKMDYQIDNKINLLPYEYKILKIKKES
ncbi:MAG: sugar phosphorylase [Acholeplasmataceae bacterium]